MSYTVIIPAYNEEKSIRRVLQELTSGIEAATGSAPQIIVIDDGSKDATGDEVRACQLPNVQLIVQRQNRGYGAALKTGVRAAQTEWVITYDADGQHTPDHILGMQEHLQDGVDMVIGRRMGKQGPWIRQPGKYLIRKVACYLTEKQIPDLNSGLRAMRRATALPFLDLFPDGFSFSTTSTVCFLKEGYVVEYFPITVQERTGTSTVRPRDAVKTLMLVVRLTMLFSPLRIFLPISIVTGFMTAVLMSYELIVHRNISDAVVMLGAFTSILFFFGLLADQIAAVHRKVVTISSQTAAQ